MKHTSIIAIVATVLVLTGLTLKTYGQISQYLMNEADSNLVIHYQNIGYIAGINAIMEYSTGPGGEEINVPVDMFVLNTADTNNIIGLSHHLEFITQEMIEIAAQNPNQHLLLYDSANFENQEAYFGKVKHDIDSLLLITGTKKPSRFVEKKNTRMEIYPNPSANSFNIKLQTLDEAKVTMSIYNNLCQPAGDLTKDLKLSKGEYNFKLNPTGLSEGMYFVNVAIHYLNGKKESHSVKIIYRK